MKNVFEVIDYKFFQVFAGENRRVNAEIIMVISDFFKKENASYVDKEDLVNYLVDYITNRNFEEMTDDEGNDITTSDAREKTLAKINLYKRNGWIIEESVENFQTIIQFDENALILIKALEDISSNATPKEYTGYIYVIDNLLRHFDYSQGISILEQIYDNTETLMSRLRGLNSSIKKYLTNLLKDDAKEADKLLKTLLGDYQDNIINKAFSNLKLSDNPSKYKSNILSKLDELRSQGGLDKLIDNYQKTKMNDNNITMIEEYLIKQIDFIYDNIQDLQQTISLIDIKNAKYVRSTTSKIAFILSDNHDVTGKIENILKLLNKNEDDDLTSEAFGLYTMKHIDQHALYKPRSYKNIPEETEIPDTPHVNTEKVDQIYANLFKDNRFSRKTINEYVQKLLINKSEMKASTIHVDNSIDLTRLILVELYSHHKMMCYQTVPLVDIVKTNKYEYKDFLIQKRGGLDGR